jgi:hypothetical protein
MADDRPADWRVEVQRRLAAGHDVVLPFARFEFSGDEVWRMGLHRLRDISDAALREAAAVLPGAIDNRLMARADPAQLREMALHLEGARLALRVRAVVATFTAAELEAELAAMALVPDNEILDGGPLLAQELHHRMVADGATDDTLRPHVLRWHAAHIVLRQQAEVGVVVGEGAGGDGMAFPGVADFGPERSLN